jgi:hypothetical protein
MPNSKIDFMLTRDRHGYRVVPKAPIPQRRSGQSNADRILAAKLDKAVDLIIGNGGALVPYKPLNKVPDLFNIFAKIPRTAEGVLNFVNTYGHFTNAGIVGGRGDMVPAILDEAEEMSKRLDRLSSSSPSLGPEIPLTKLLGFVVRDRASGGITLKLVPATLRDALWLQLAEALSAGSKIRKCRFELCGEWFRAGVGADRRADAEFCSDEHRKRFNSLIRRGKR